MMEEQEVSSSQSQPVLPETGIGEAEASGGMTFVDARQLYSQNGDSFDLINLASEKARPEIVREWFDYAAYRPSYAAAWAAMMDDPLLAFQQGSPLDGLAQGAFVEGWTAALRRVGSMLGISQEVFASAIDLAGETGRDLLPEWDIVRLQAVRPRAVGEDDTERYFADIEAAMLGSGALNTSS